MNTEFSTRLAQVKPSPSIAAKTRVDALRAAGRDIIDFTIGEPDFATPDHIVQSGMRALADGATRYTGSAGTPAPKNAVRGKLQRENQLTFGADQIIVGAGAKQLIYIAFAATLNEGDEVIVPAPYWVSYPDMVILNGGTPVIAPSSAEAGFKLTPAALSAAITPRSRWLVLNTPNNPSGAIYTAAELSALCEVLRQHPQLRVMTDEIYEHFAFGGAHHVSPLHVAPDLADRTLVVNGVSKAYAMTGWRVGYAAGPADLIRAMTLLASQTTTCASAVGQAAAVTALEGPQDCVAEACKLFEERRDRMVMGLSDIVGVQCSRPDGAFYLFPSVQGLIGKTTPEGRQLMGDPDVAAYLLDSVGVASVDGSSYGMPAYLRLSFATSLAEIDRGCKAVAAAIAALA